VPASGDGIYRVSPISVKNHASCDKINYVTA